MMVARFAASLYMLYALRQGGGATASGEGLPYHVRIKIGRSVPGTQYASGGDGVYIALHLIMAYLVHYKGGRGLRGATLVHRLL